PASGRAGRAAASRTRPARWASASWRAGPPRPPEKPRSLRHLRPDARLMTPYCARRARASPPPCRAGGWPMPRARYTGGGREYHPEGRMSAVPQSDEPLLLREDRDGIAWLTMNRPQQMNLPTSEMLAALQGAFDAIAEDESVRVVVLAGAGKGFCAGHDLKEIRALGEQPKIRDLFDRCSRMMMSIPRLPQPVLARVHGAAAAA